MQERRVPFGAVSVRSLLVQLVWHGQGQLSMQRVPTVQDRAVCKWDMRRYAAAFPSCEMTFAAFCLTWLFTPLKFSIFYFL